MNHGFQFKQFFIAHDRCAMKVNTDGILLGATADPKHAQSILDLGTGTGLVAIMLAQRSNAQITAVEIEPNAYLQAVQNCKKSAFSARLQVLNLDVITLNLDEKFDLIVANPPYFFHSLASKSEQRDLARAATQSHLAWLNIAKNHLSEQGKISFILPFDAAKTLIAESLMLGLHCIEQVTIHTTPNKPPKRMIATFSFHNFPCQCHSLTIYDEKNSYTLEFKELTHDFYLNF